MINFQQSVNIREILLCSTLSERAVKIEFKQQQGSHLQRLLRLLQILQTGCKVEVKPQSLIYIPGILTNRDGEPIKFDCGDRSISYFLEIILILSLYAKAELNLELEGVTNDSIDCSVDTIINAFIPLVKRFAPEWICQVKVTRRDKKDIKLVQYWENFNINCRDIKNLLINAQRHFCDGRKYILMFRKSNKDDSIELDIFKILINNFIIKIISLTT